ncbi:ATP-binding protein [Corynebacterium testudinoris]|uniref:ATP-binding protein n=1 Tax=Corynebacterium testudinoris TaxID=136857 RepID=UPI0006998751|nr:ATP-binding protein [Corynebacterium testudinoris]
MINQVTTTELLALDSFPTTPINTDTSNMLLIVLYAREGKGSMMVTSQFDPEKWYTSMAEKVVAESLLNRLVGGAEIISLDGPNMRLRPTIVE